MTDPIARPAARVLLIDGAGRVLLFRGGDPGRPGVRFWVTVGGGLDPGETTAQGAARELYEETGLRLDAAELGPVVYQDSVVYPFDGVWYRAEQDYYAVRVEAWEVDTTGFEELERQFMDSHRWWSADELDATPEKYYPPDLPALIRELLAEGGVPTGGSAASDDPAALNGSAALDGSAASGGSDGHGRGLPEA